LVGTCQVFLARPAKIDRCWLIKERQAIQKMETLAQATYFLTAVMVTTTNPFLTLLLISVLIIDGSFYNIMVAYIVPGLLSTVTIVIYAAPIILLIAAAKYYDH
jgi:threonine/homoserine/homoserine lactone efflux protein